MILNLTAEVMAELAGQGRFWWAQPDGTCYATTEKTPDNMADSYLLDASPNWVAQWPDWDAAATALAPVIAQLEGNSE